MTKVLAFTASFDRWVFAQNDIRGMLAQTYKNMVYCINFIETEEYLLDMTRLNYAKEIAEGRLMVMTSPKNESLFKNAMSTIEFGLQKNPDVHLIVKIDDDDWY